MSYCGTRLEFPPARAYVAGNFSADGWTDHINTKGTETVPFPVPPVNTTNACTAAHQVLAQAGVSPRDSVDEQYLSAILPPLCPEITSPVPGSVLAGADVTFSWAANGAAVRNWRLYIGSTQGAKDLHDSGTLSANGTSKEVRKLPTDGRTIWVQLRFGTTGPWEFVDFQYTARR